jgi:lysyl-tRNA synthetase class I
MVKRKQKIEEHVNKVKTICPKCEKICDVTILDYKTNKKGDGITYTYKCLGCKEKFYRELKFSFKLKEK